MAIALKTIIVALVLAIGLDSTASDVTYLWHRPVKLMKALLAMYVVVPLAVVLLIHWLELPRATELAMAILAICAGAPLLPKKLLKLGVDPTYVFSLVVTTSLLAIFTVPLGVWLLSERLGVEWLATPSKVAPLVLLSFLLPLAVGMMVRAFFPKLAERVGGPLLQWANVALTVLAVVLLVAGWRILAGIGLATLLAFSAFALIALVAGHWLGGPEPGERTSLATACASRHVGLALLVGAEYKGPQVSTMVAAYLIASMLVSIPYLRWRSRSTVASRHSAD